MQLDLRPSLFFVTVLMLSPVIHAQVNPVSGQLDQRQRGQFVDGVLRTLVDSRLNLDPREPLAPVPRGSAQPQGIRQARLSIQLFANEADQLITALRYEERYSSYLRGLLGDALRVKATADVLYNRTKGIADVTQMASEYAELDRQWRLLGYQLQQTADLSNTVMQRVERLNQINEALGQQLKLTPQMDQDDLIYFFSAVSESLAHLSEDVRIDLYSHPQRDPFRQGLTQLQTRAQQLRLAVESRYPYADIARYYKQFHNDWLSLKGDLRTVDNRYIQRNLGRITQINDRIHELLWLPPVIDGRDVLYQAEALQQQIDKVANDVSMFQLIQLPNSTDMFNRCKEFYKMCGDFRQTVATETQLDNVRWDFRVLDVAWNDLKGELGPIETSELIQDIAAIDNRIQEMRNSLGLQSTFDFAEAMELVSSLQNMSDLLYDDINRNIGRSNQFSAQFRNRTVSLSNQFNQTAKLLSGNMTSQNDEQKLQQLSRQLAEQWQELQGYIAQIPADQRMQLARTSQHIAPLMAKLQVMYGF